MASGEEETGIYRGEVLAIMGALSDVYANTEHILTLLRGEDEDEEEEEMDP